MSLKLYSIVPRLNTYSARKKNKTDSHIFWIKKVDTRQIWRSRLWHLWKELRENEALNVCKILMDPFKSDKAVCIDFFKLQKQKLCVLLHKYSPSFINFRWICTCLKHSIQTLSSKYAQKHIINIYYKFFIYKMLLFSFWPWTGPNSF